MSLAAKSLLGKPARLSFVRVPQMHMTLKFLGEIPEPEISKITEVLFHVHGAPYTISVAGFGVFGRPLRVIRAEVSDGGKSGELSLQIDSLLFSVGIPIETKTFSPHLNLARVKEYSPDLLTKVAAIRDIEFGNCIINEVVLKKSTLTPSGPIYETIAGVKL